MPIDLDSGSLQDVQSRLDRLQGAASPPIPQVRLFNSGNIVVANNTPVTLTFDSEIFDNGDMHGSTTSRAIAPITGLYYATADVTFASNSTGVRRVRLVHSGGTEIARDMRQAVNGDVTEINIDTIYRFAAGEYVTVVVLQTSGGNLNVTASGISPSLSMVRLGGYVNVGV